MPFMPPAGVSCSLRFIPSPTHHIGIDLSSNVDVPPDGWFLLCSAIVRSLTLRFSDTVLTTLGVGGVVDGEFAGKIQFRTTACTGCKMWSHCIDDACGGPTCAGLTHTSMAEVDPYLRPLRCQPYCTRGHSWAKYDFKN